MACIPNLKIPFVFCSKLLAVSLLLTLAGCGSGGKMTREELEKKVLKLERKVEDLESAVYKDRALDKLDNFKSKEAATLLFEDLGNLPSKDMILELAKLGVFLDNQSGKFQPMEPVTRGEYAIWLFKSYNAIVPQSKRLELSANSAPLFHDLASDHGAFPYVQALAMAGYPMGYPDKTFKPNKPLSRQEMIAMKVGVDLERKIQPNMEGMKSSWHFKDMADIAPTYSGYIAEDITIGGPRGNNIKRAFNTETELEPKKTVLRYEAAASLWQIGSTTTGGRTAHDVLQEQNKLY